MSEEPSPPRRKAVALRYQSGQDTAPRVVAGGTGLVAERIIELAQEHGVYIHEDPELLRVLASLKVNTEIPESLYKAVAGVLAFVFRLNQRQQALGASASNASDTSQD